MQKEIELIRYIRSNILTAIESLSLEQLNRIPEKFNNNIAWNLAHLVITQQSMSYRLGGLPIPVDEQWFGDFTPGSKPERDLTITEISMIKEMLKSTINKFEQDYQNGKFNSYTPWNLHGIMEVSGVEDATKITCVHEGRHYGVITSIVKMVS